MTESVFPTFSSENTESCPQCGEMGFMDNYCETCCFTKISLELNPNENLIDYHYEYRVLQRMINNIMIGAKKNEDDGVIDALFSAHRKQAEKQIELEDKE